jgi:hypothetical protein
MREVELRLRRGTSVVGMDTVSLFSSSAMEMTFGPSVDDAKGTGTGTAAVWPGGAPAKMTSPP